jgi:hypothetical protein
MIGHRLARVTPARTSSFGYSPRVMEACLSSPRMAFAQTPHMSCGDVAVGWLTLPAGAVLQWVQPVRATRAHAEWLVGPAAAKLDQRYPRHRALTIVLDFELMTGRTAASRSLLLAKARQLSGRVARCFVVLPRQASPAHLHGIRAGIALARAFGIPVEVADSAARAIASAGLRVAP